MPEELGVFLFILIAVGWLIVKTGADANRRKTKRLAKQRAGLQVAVKTVLPNQLERAENRLAAAEHEFKQWAGSTNWIPSSPLWKHVTFQPHRFRPQTERYQEMYIEDLEAILSPDDRPWSKIESAILATKCRYPAPGPHSNCLPFKEYSPFELNLDPATFSYVRPLKVRAYNRRRVELLAQRDALNAEIDKWNVEARAKWEFYAGQTKALADQEISKYRTAASTYVESCGSEKRHLGTTLSGYKKRSKQFVVERFNHALAAIVLPASAPRTWQVDFDEQEGILVVELALPDVVHHPPAKHVTLKSGVAAKPLNQTEKKPYCPKTRSHADLRIGLGGDHDLSCRSRSSPRSKIME